MSDLSSDGEALVQAGRKADRPSDADRERVLAALKARLGEAALLSTGLPHTPSVSGATASRSPFVKWAWVGSTVLVAGAFWLVPRFSPKQPKAVPAPQAPQASVVSSVSSEAKAAADDAPEAPPGAGVLVEATASSRPDTQKVPARARDGLSEEVALLSRAETELRAGRPAKALLALGEHQRKFPRGALAEERMAARIQALCALGRNDEANAQLGQLLHVSPNSAHGERARQACRDSRASP